MNAFNDYFVLIVENRLMSINSSFLNNMPNWLIIFQRVEDVIAFIAIPLLPLPQNNGGHDNISNRIIKWICSEIITKPLFLIINQMLATGIFRSLFYKEIQTCSRITSNIFVTIISKYLWKRLYTINHVIIYMKVNTFVKNNLALC